MKRGWFYVLVLFSCALLTGGPGPRPAAAADEWQPINPADLAMKDSPDSPGADAIYLYRGDDEDDIAGWDQLYYRMKIFTEKGKDHADIEIPYLHAGDLNFKITDIRARSIHPDGRIVDWTGKPMDKLLIKERGLKVLARTFSIPDVEVGSIIEYKYRRTWDPQTLWPSTWFVQEDMFTRQAHFMLHPSNDYATMWISYQVPGNRNAERAKNGNFALDIQNVPGIEKEDYMPPENTLKGRIDFFYTERTNADQNKFWADMNKKWFDASDRFIGRRKAIEEEASRVAPSSDPPDMRLRKLYARAQEIRNLDFERQKTEKEEQREKLKENSNVEDVLKRAVGTGTDIDYLFCGLARAAGFDASIVRVSTRDEYFFDPRLQEAEQLNEVVVAVKSGDKDIFYDPGNAHAPYGILPWRETGVQGLELGKQAGQFVTTTQPVPGDAVIQRVAKLQLSDDGWLSGKLTVTYIGREALSQRLDAGDKDDTDRKKQLEDDVKSWVPAGSTVTLTNSPDWAGSDPKLVAEFDIRMRPVGTSTGRRLLLADRMFATAWTRQFEHPARKYPIYLRYPFYTQDDVTLQLPLQLEIGSVPPPQKIDDGIGIYEVTCEKQGVSLHISHKMGLDGYYYAPMYYTLLRNFLNSARAGDEQQIVLQTSGTAGSQQ